MKFLIILLTLILGCSKPAETPKTTDSNSTTPKDFQEASIEGWTMLLPNDAQDITSNVTYTQAININQNTKAVYLWDTSKTGTPITISFNLVSLEDKSAKIKQELEARAAVQQQTFMSYGNTISSFYDLVLDGQPAIFMLVILKQQSAGFNHGKELMTYTVMVGSNHQAAELFITASDWAFARREADISKIILSIKQRK